MGVWNFDCTSGLRLRCKGVGNDIMVHIGLLGSYVVVTTVTGIPRTFRKREKVTIPKIVIILVAFVRAC